MQLECGADVRFDSGAQMLYDCPDHVAQTVFDLGTWILESCNKKKQGSFELKHICWELIKNLRRERESEEEGKTKVVLTPDQLRVKISN